MKKYVHVGVPTDKVMEGSIYAEGIKTHIVPPETNEFGIEYLRFEKDRIAFIMKDGILMELMEEVK